MKQAAAEILSEFGGELRDDYSGRSMYGKTTHGIVFENQQEFFSAIADIMEGSEEDERELVAEAIRYLKTDNMGLSIIYY